MKPLVRLILLGLAVSALALGGCAPSIPTVTKAEYFPGMYEEMPGSIIILPPMNESTAADAKDYYATTIQEPLALNGYYTFPMPITNDILKEEGVYDTELLYSLPVTKFKEYFGADAVLFTKIKRWDVTYIVFASYLIVSFDSEIRSTTTDRVLWNYRGTVQVDLSGGGGGGGLAGLIAQAVVTAVNTAAADYVPYARQANFYSYSAMPLGKYHSRFLQDQQDRIVDQRALQAKAEAKAAAQTPAETSTDAPAEAAQQ